MQHDDGDLRDAAPPDPNAPPATDGAAQPPAPVAADARAADVPAGADHPADPAAAAVPAVLDIPDVLARLGRIEVTLAEMADRLAAETDRAAARERVIDRQRADIERLRDIERDGMLRPVVTDLCALRNDLLRQAATLGDAVTAEGASRLLASFADGVEEALERCGVAVLPREVGALFVAGRHQVAGVVEVPDPLLDGTVAAVVQDGYAEIDGGKVVAPARVTLHRVPAGVPAGPPAAEATSKEHPDE